MNYVSFSNHKHLEFITDEGILASFVMLTPQNGKTFAFVKYPLSTTFWRT